MKIISQTFIALFVSLFLISSTKILNPDLIEPYQFTEQITGQPNIFEPTKVETDLDGRIVQEIYEITMKKITYHLLPSKLNLQPTPLYAYGGNTKEGEIFSFPGPSLMAKQGVPAKVVWRNMITGKHMFPIDISEPFNSSSLFVNEVPVVPHAHGLATPMTSDGGPQSFWTATGEQSPHYHTQEKCDSNQAVYKYPNQQQSGLYWYHDHAYGITRLNVYAGLAGFYQILDNPQLGSPSLAEESLKRKFGDLETRYFAISDKSFNTDGTLHYPDESFSKDFTSWVPQFFGNTIVVNDKVWPQVQLQKKVYRLVFLNSCQCRFLNIYFLHESKKLPFQLIRMQADYFPTPIVSTSYLLSLGARMEILLDLTQINGEVIMKNNAPAPHPNGDPENLIDSQTGTIMKIVTKPVLNEKKEYINLRSNDNYVRLKDSSQYPKFPAGNKVFTTLHQFQGEDQESIGMMIDGIPMEMTADCSNPLVPKLKSNQVYDYYIINLTPDSHPMHIHLVNIQKVFSFPFDVDRYTEDLYQLNGEPTKRGFDKIPQMIDPEFYRTGVNIPPRPWQKVFRDVIDAYPDLVTVVRFKVSHNDGSPFSFNISGSRYVWHCHMLEHEDNEMMKYFCIE